MRERFLRNVDIPDEAASDGMRAAGLPQYVIDGLIGTFAVLRADTFNYCTDDVEKVTGRAPHSFETWCQNHVDAFR